MDKIYLTTEDGVKLAGSLWAGDSPYGILLLHQMPAIKESWTELAERLNERGLTVLAIDFRGHGESEGGNYKEFSDAEHQQYALDVEAAMEYLHGRFAAGQVFLGGASIGANEVLKYMAEHHEVPKGFALSAGLNYHGVRGIDSVKTLASHQQVLFMASLDDVSRSGENRGKMTEELYAAAACRKEKIISKTGGHGVEMLETHTELMDKVISFFID